MRGAFLEPVPDRPSRIGIVACVMERSAVHQLSRLAIGCTRGLRANRLVAAILPLLLASPSTAQSSASQIRALLEAELISKEVVKYQLSRYLMNRVPEPPRPQSAQEWTREAPRIRERIRATILRGWPSEWVERPLAAEDRGLVPGTGEGYRVRKLRLEVIPGLHVAALLYEPEGVQTPAPAVLNVNGHIYGKGKEIEYKQKRCIHQAKQGIYALNLDWLYFGELTHPENQHWFGAHLDLTGANGIGLFYLAMRKGLDYLYEHPSVDRERIGMTGLSGGGWQTVLLSALDERVRAAVPVAGHSSLVSRLEDFGPGDVGDWEQKGTDLLSEFEYTHLTALIAPRPLLQIHNAEDIFRSHRVKPGTFDALESVWDVYGASEDFQFHENFDPADHNYQLDNRMQAYRFFAQRFGLLQPEREFATGSELRTAAELEVGLPGDNLTILQIARKLASRIQRAPIPVAPPERRTWAREQRQVLRETLRFAPVGVERAWFLAGTRMKGLDSRAYRFDFENGLSASGVLFHAITGSSDPRPATIVLHDEGRAAAAETVSERINRGERVLAADLIFTGEATLPGDRPERNIQVLAAIGERPLGVEVAQLLALAEWMGPGPKLETHGIRSQVAALAAAALAPGAFSDVVTHEGVGSLVHLLEEPVSHPDAPDLFCFGLLRDFDIDRLQALAGN